MKINRNDRIWVLDCRMIAVSFKMFSLDLEHHSQVTKCSYYINCHYNKNKMCLIKTKIIIKTNAKICVLSEIVSIL